MSLEYVRSEKNLTDPLTKGLTKQVVLDTSKGMELKPKRSRIILNTHYILILMMCGNACERLSSYALNGYRAR